MNCKNTHVNEINLLANCQGLDSIMILDRNLDRLAHSRQIVLTC